LANCHAKKKHEEQKASATHMANVAEEHQYAFVTGPETTGRKITNKTWIADSEATCHIMNDSIRLYKTETIYEPVTIGDGKTVHALLNGKLDVKVESDDAPMTMTLNEMKFVLGFWVKLFSITCAIKKGSKITIKQMTLKVEKVGKCLIFKNCIKATNSCIIGIKMKAFMKETAQATLIVSKLKMTGLHGRRLGHVSNDTMMKTAKFYSWKIAEELKECRACKLGKAQQNNLSKEKNKRSKAPGERLFLDISSTQPWKVQILAYVSRQCYRLLLEPLSEIQRQNS